MKKYTDFLTALCPALIWLVPVLICEGICFCLSLLCAVFVHEGGHMLAFFLTGAGVPRLSGSFAGLTLTPKRQLSYPDELVIAFFGPLFNLFFAFLLLLFSQYYENEILHLLIGVNVSCALCNLLPVFELDGGRVLFSLCAMIFPFDVAEKTRKVISATVLAVLLFLSLWLILFLDVGYRILMSVALIIIASDKSKR